MPKTSNNITLLSTGQAAKLCSVTPDALLKWIKCGVLPAGRTAGGHYRIRREDVERLRRQAHEGVFQAPGPHLRAAAGHHFRYCWEHNGNGRLLKGCRECVVYMLRAQRCYKVAKFAPQIGHNKLFCKRSCEECDYYRMVREQATNILVFTDNQDLAESLAQAVEHERFRLETTDCEYKCSALVDVFRPDYVVIDCSLGQDTSRDICRHLVQDPRVPYVRVIMAGADDEFPEGCDKEVFARIEKPFGMREIVECIDGVPTVEGSQA
jgi:excisionase family DNA binding protein